VTGQLYVEKKAPKSLRASAQGFFNLLTYGVGMLIGNYLLGWWGDRIELDGATQQGWLDGAFAFWIMPAIAALGVAIFFFIFFWDDEVEAKTIDPNVSTLADTDPGETSPGTVA
jgi:MFS family permease